MILVDTSAWIEYLKGNPAFSAISRLIDTNTICTNDLILAELIPSIVHKNEYELRDLLFRVTNIAVSVRWDGIIQMQTMNLRNGINRVGIPDLIIAQNAVDNDLPLFARDSHFALMAPLHGISLFGN